MNVILTSHPTTFFIDFLSFGKLGQFALFSEIVDIFADFAFICQKCLRYSFLGFEIGSIVQLLSSACCVLSFILFLGEVKLERLIFNSI